MNIAALYRKYRNKFLDGPDWYYTRALDKRPGSYRSITAAALIWTLAFYGRLFTVPAQFLFPAGTMIILYSLIAWNSPMRLVGLALFVAFLIDLAGALIFRPKLEITRQVPRRVRAGSTFTVRYPLRNLRRLSAWDIKLDNYRLPPGLEVVSPAALGVIPPGRQLEARAEIIAFRRGKYDIFSPIAESAFPLGLFKMSRRKKAASDVLLVYPAFHELVSLDLPVALRYQKEGNARVSKVGESLDFFGNREFREGDDLRHLDWAGSARAGELIIKEFQQEYLSRIAVIVDTYVSPVTSFRLRLSRKQSFAELEAALSLASALIDYLTRGEYVVDIFATGLDVYHFKAGRHLSCFDDIMDILAALEVNHRIPVSEISASVIEEISGVGSAVVLLQGWGREGRKLISRLNNYGIRTKVIIIGNHKKISVPSRFQVFSAADIQKGKAVKL
ncbi:MAG: DUF58 domain-containing protein [Victivallaceae bacterium]|nr:DUF58 domain-containing protein [Victivallaceae bacterium]